MMSPDTTHYRNCKFDCFHVIICAQDGKPLNGTYVNYGMSDKMKRAIHIICGKLPGEGNTVYPSLNIVLNVL